MSRLWWISRSSRWLNGSGLWCVSLPGLSSCSELWVRGRDEPQAHVRAWFGSVSGREVTALLPLQEGQKQRLSLELPEPSKTLDRDVRRVALVDGRGKALGQKSIPVMLVQKPPRWPWFGATSTKSPRWAKVSWRPIVFSVTNAGLAHSAWRPDTPIMRIGSGARAGGARCE